jgi:hypothetical protein
MPIGSRYCSDTFLAVKVVIFEGSIITASFTFFKTFGSLIKSRKSI